MPRRGAVGDHMRRMAFVAMIAMALGYSLHEGHAGSSERPADRADPRGDSPAPRGSRASETPAFPKSSGDGSTVTCTVEIEELPPEDIAGVDMGPMARPVRYDGLNGPPQTIRRLGAGARSQDRIELSEQIADECDEEIEDERVISRMRERADLG